jgi:hypothetical protein
MLRGEVEELGFAILSEVFTSGEIQSLLEQLARTPLPRSRAGMRHALRHPAVLAVPATRASSASPSRFSDANRCHSELRFLTNLRRPTGLLSGIKTPPCRSGHEMSPQGGGRGR